MLPRSCYCSGSHDSFAWTLDKTGPLSPDVDKTIADLVKIFGPLAKNIIYNFSVAQNYNPIEQLEAGIRYFDIRLSRKENSTDIYVVHGLFGPKIDEILLSLKSFLTEHQKEVILLDFNHFYGMSAEDHRGLMGRLEEVFGSLLCPVTDMESVTLEGLWSRNQQVLVFYHEDVASSSPLFWPGSSIPSPWPNVSDPARLLQFLETHYEGGRPADRFYVTQGILTPDAKYIMSHLDGSLQQTAESVSEPLTTWLSQKSAGSTGINVCIMDFVNLADFSPCVIKLNEKS